MTKEHEVIRKITESHVILNEEEIRMLIPTLTQKRLAKGELLLDKGQIARDFIYVDKGLIRQFYYKKGRDVTEHLSCEGRIAFCIISMFRQSPTELMVEALEPSVVYLLSHQKLKQLALQNVQYALLYQGLLESALEVSQRKADSWRFETAKERYTRFVQEYPEVAKRASINHISSYLLMAPESLSRVRSGYL